MKILITGANGFIGKSLIAEALAQGFQVVALVRSKALIEWEGVNNIELIYCDLDKDEIPNLSGFSIDCVVHLAVSMNPKEETNADYDALLGTKKIIAEMLRSKIKKLIGMSSISVIDFENLAALSTINEDVALASNHQEMGKYSILKARQEGLYSAFGAGSENQCVIIRPGLVYSSDTLNPAHAGIIKSKFQLLIDHKGEVPLVDVDSVVKAMLIATGLNSAKLEIVHLLDYNLPSQAQYIDLLRQRRHIKAGGIVLAWWVVSPLIKMMFHIANVCNKTGKLPDSFLPHAFAARMKPFYFSNVKAKQLLNWVPKSFQE